MGYENKIIRAVRAKAQSVRNKPKMVFAEGEYFNVLKAAIEIQNDGIAKVVVLGREDKIKRIAEEYSLQLDGIEIINPRSKEMEEKRWEYGKHYWEKRKRKGLTLEESYMRMYEPNNFGIMMVEMNDADTFISGYASKYREVLKPAIRMVGKREDVTTVAGMYIVLTKKGPFFFADTTVNPNPTPETLVCNARLAAKEIEKFGIEPVIAMLSYSNFGSVRDTDTALKVQKAVEIAHEKYPELIIDGDLQANLALNREIRDKLFPFSKLYGKDVNTLIFPSLSSGNIAYKLMQELGGSEVIGPIILGLNKPIHIVPINSSVREITYMASIAAVDAISRRK